MSRRAYLDASAAGTRVVVTLGGRPERLWVEADARGRAHGAGARWIGRVGSTDRRIAAAPILAGGGEIGLVPAGAVPHEGAWVEVEIVAEARRGKAAGLRVVGAAAGPDRMLAPAPDLAERLASRCGGPPQTGSRAAEIADLAEAEALAIVHPLPGGGDLSIERTRGLTAVDIDLAGRAGEGARARAALNRTALETVARLLRLKRLGGVVVIDLVGRGQQGEFLMNVARTAFEPDQPGVSVGPISRLGLLQVALPWRERPLDELLIGPDGRLTAAARADRLIREAEREARAEPGGRVRISAPPDVAAQMDAGLAALAARYGGRFEVEVRPGAGEAMAL